MGGTWSSPELIDMSGGTFSIGVDLGAIPEDPPEGWAPRTVPGPSNLPIGPYGIPTEVGYEDHVGRAAWEEATNFGNELIRIHQGPLGLSWIDFDAEHYDVFRPLVDAFWEARAQVAMARGDLSKLRYWILRLRSVMRRLTALFEKLGIPFSPRTGSR